MPYTHGHAVVNLWLLDRFLVRPSQGLVKARRLWWPILVEGMLPDFPLLIFILIEVPKHGASMAFDEIYYQQFWQDVFGYAHSIPLSFIATILLAIPLVYSYGKATKQTGGEVLKCLVKGVARKCCCCSAEKSSDSIKEEGHRMEKSDDTIPAGNATEGNRNDPMVTVTRDEEEGTRDDVDSRDGEDPTSSNDFLGDAEKHKDLSPSRGLFWSQAFCFLFASMFFHSFADVWLHTDDAHSQLLPFSRAKFYSKISYWNVEEFAWIWMPFEAGLVFVSSRYMLQKLTARWSRWVMYGVIVSYVLILGVTLIGAIQLVV